jgi:hypothetical protein
VRWRDGYKLRHLPSGNSKEALFSWSNTLPISIAPGAAPVPITIRFKPLILTDQNPMAPDQQTGTLSIISNDPSGFVYWRPEFAVVRSLA